MFDVRVAIPADAEQLGDVYAEAWRVGEGVCCPPEVFDDELELRRKIFPVLARRAQRHSVTRLDQEAHIRGTLLVAESAGRVVGFIHFGPMDQGSMRGYRPLNGEDLGEVYRIYVHPTVRGQGCARLLMDEAVAAMAETYRSAVLWTHAGNARAKRFFANAGWSETGRQGVDTWFEDSDIAIVEYGRTLELRVSVDR